MEAIGRLAGGIAHDFNNLLTAVVGHTDLLAMSLPPEHPAHESLREIRRAGDRATDLTRQLLAYGARQVLQPKLVDLNAMVEEVCRLLRPTIRENIELSLALAQEPGLVRIDAAQLEQVLVNLVLNARDAMAEGGRITLSTKSVLLEEGVGFSGAPLPRGDYVLVRVVDTGIGMDAATRAQLFEPFFTTKGLANGTGLGLATAWGLVRQSGGDMRVESEPGQGAAFEIYLPRAKPDGPVPAALPAMQPGRPADPVHSVESTRGGNAQSDANGVVLFAEDEPVVRTMVVRLLEQVGYKVLSARDGEAALELAHTHDGPIDVLLTDVVMPRLGGRALAERLKAERPSLRVIYMSGYAEDATLRAGGLDEARFIQKPFDPKVLAKAIHEAMAAALHARAAVPAGDRAVAVELAADADVELQRVMAGSS
jgi:CheY-like chemotaxis protein